MAINYKELFSVKRFHVENSRTPEEEFSSDKSRVIFSSSFRRLQQKAQVFSLERNASVRSRLTHTLEVANTGVLIAKRIAQKLIKSGELEPEYLVPFIDLVETTCLLHDIGNPPFGHFGEAAIRKWFCENYLCVIQNANLVNEDEVHTLINGTLINDFIHFDGNPQGLRIAMHLQELPGKQNGFNLTYTQLLSAIKYLANPNCIDSDKPLYKKAGFFHSEANNVEKIKSELNWRYRFPLTYIMEAADDISYCLSDIEDGIEKGILTAEDFFKYLNKNLKSTSVTFLGEYQQSTKADFFVFKIKLTKKLIEHSAETYLNSSEKIISGDLTELIEKKSEFSEVLKALKNLSRQFLFRSKEAENNELAGYRIIYGLLDFYKPILELTNENFSYLVDAKNDFRVLSNKNLDIEWRLFNRLPDKHLEAYKAATLKLNKEVKGEYEQYLWFYRAHLIVDFISGMTDNFALETYRLLNGIEL